MIGLIHVVVFASFPEDFWFVFFHGHMLIFGGFMWLAWEIWKALPKANDIRALRCLIEQIEARGDAILVPEGCRVELGRYFRFKLLKAEKRGYSIKKEFSFTGEPIDRGIVRFKELEGEYTFVLTYVNWYLDVPALKVERDGKAVFVFLLDPRRSRELRGEVLIDRPGEYAYARVSVQNGEIKGDLYHSGKAKKAVLSLIAKRFEEWEVSEAPTLTLVECSQGYAEFSKERPFERFVVVTSEDFSPRRFVTALKKQLGLRVRLPILLGFSKGEYVLRLCLELPRGKKVVEEASLSAQSY